MSQEDRVADLFDRALALDPRERSQFLASECGLEAALAAEVAALLKADQAATANPAWSRSPVLDAAQLELRDPDIGGSIGPYRIVELIGSGGMGKVYRAVRADSQYEKSVAIKRIKRGMDADRIVARFRAERQILANLEHECIARLLDGGVAPDGLPYLVMEFVDGTTPSAYSAVHKLGVGDRLRLFRRICDAVHYAHQRMVVHRDLKPSNILITGDGVPKLLDFGIAKVFTPTADTAGQPETETGMLLLTVRYASPEQIRGESVTTATDIYSLGVLLYELLTEQSPYRAAGAATHELMRCVCEDDPIKPSIKNPELRGDLDNVILKALRKAPAERYTSADQFSEDVLRYLQGRPVLARPQSLGYVASKFVRRNRVGVAAAALLLTSIGAGILGIARTGARAERRFNEVRQLAHSVIFDYHDAIENLPGSTPVRKRLVQDALKYLDSLSREADDPELQREMVDAYVRISRVEGDTNHNNLGDTEGALRTAARAVEIAGHLLRQTATADSLSSSAAAYSTLGSLLHSRGDLKQAEEASLRAVDLLQRAVQANPGDMDLTLRLSESFRSLADLYGGSGMQNLGRSSEALELYRKSAQLGQMLCERYPREGRPLKERRAALVLLAGLETSLGRFDEADRDLAEALRIGEEIVLREPADTAQQLELANICLRSGLRLLDEAKPLPALTPIRRAEGILEKLLTADPRNALYQRDLSVTESHLATALRFTGELTMALAHNRRSLALAGALSESDPRSVEYRADSGISHRKLAETLLAAGLDDAALTEATKASDTLCELAQASPDAYLQAHCMRALLTKGDTQVKMRSWPASEESYAKAYRIASRISAADPSNTALRSDLARAEAAMAAISKRRGEAHRRSSTAC